ncbi:MAG: hypothetical protein PUD63_12430 [Clostridia bacterium]|nr:hypothetical protein [Clostridia bacterium]MDD6041980.1 hypothetical protein [Clostridia bacterium]
MYYYAWSSIDCFYAMVLNGKYLRAVLGKFKLREWSNYVKWSVEGAFEYVRQTEYPQCCSRIRCNYFYDDLAACKSLFAYDWGDATEEERSQIHLFEMQVDAETVERRDMRLYDEAYDAMRDAEDVAKVLDCARCYFAGEGTPDPVWEVLSDKPARAVEDVTEILHE